MIIFILLLSRPWYAPVTVDFSQVPSEAKVSVFLEDSWGREVIKKYDPKQGQQVEYNSARVTKLQTDSESPVTISLQWHMTVVSYSVTKQLNINDSVPTRRWTLANVAAMTLLSTLCIILLFLMLCEWENVRGWSRKSKFGFGLVSTLITFVGLCLSPGLFGWDIVGNFVSAARYESSPFTGRFYAYLITAGYQLIPSLGLVTAANVFVTLLSLFHIFSFAQRRGLETLFYLALALFIFYPANFYMTYFPSRDLSAFWCFVMTALKMYEIWIDRDRSWKSFVWLTLFATCAVLLRQEALVPVVLILLYNIFKQQKAKRKVVALTLLVPVLSWASLSFLKRDNPLSYDFYESTILVNPLSSILVAKYGKELPTNVSERLGPFFKNDFLITHHNPYDIDPFHYGGLDRAKATHESFLQFRSSAVGIILENPMLFMENRWEMAKTMLGFNLSRYLYIEDNYNTRWDPYLDKMFDSLPAQDYKRWSWVEDILNSWKAFVTSKPEIYFSSYLVPVVLWLVCLFFFSSRHFIIFSLIVLVRTMLVFLIAPAAYYKYQLPVWMFVPFGCIYLYAEKQKISL